MCASVCLSLGALTAKLHDLGFWFRSEVEKNVEIKVNQRSEFCWTSRWNLKVKVIEVKVKCQVWKANIKVVRWSFIYRLAGGSSQVHFHNALLLNNRWTPFVITPSKGYIIGAGMDQIGSKGSSHEAEGTGSEWGRSGKGQRKLTWCWTSDCTFCRNPWSLGYIAQANIKSCQIMMPYLSARS